MCIDARNPGLNQCPTKWSEILEELLRSAGLENSKQGGKDAQFLATVLSHLCVDVHPILGKAVSGPSSFPSFLYSSLTPNNKQSGDL